MRILVVEDVKKIATFVQRGLKESGFVVDLVHNGDEALDILLNHRFDGRYPGHHAPRSLFPELVQKELDTGVIYRVFIAD